MNRLPSLARRGRLHRKGRNGRPKASPHFFVYFSKAGKNHKERFTSSGEARQRAEAVLQALIEEIFPIELDDGGVATKVYFTFSPRPGLPPYDRWDTNTTGKDAPMPPQPASSRSAPLSAPPTNESWQTRQATSRKQSWRSRCRWASSGEYYGKAREGYRKLPRNLVLIHWFVTCPEMAPR